MYFLEWLLVASNYRVVIIIFLFFLSLCDWTSFFIMIIYNGDVASEGVGGGGGCGWSKKDTWDGANNFKSFFFLL